MLQNCNIIIFCCAIAAEVTVARLQQNLYCVTATEFYVTQSQQNSTQCCRYATHQQQQQEPIQRVQQQQQQHVQQQGLNPLPRDAPQVQ